jgi:hypothetical protein
MTTTLRIAAALVALSTFALGGCAAEQTDSDVASSSSDEGNELGATVDELATTGPTYPAGTKLTTIANLNLRSGGSTDASILKVMPSGSEVTVAESSGSNGWVKISFSSYTGWGHTSYLAETNGADDGAEEPAAASGDYSSARGNKLATTALRVDGHPSGGQCALEMSNSVVRSGIIPSGVSWRRGNAWDLANSMKNDSAYLRRVGFVNKTTNLTTRTAPKGTIVGWRPGQCGYNRTYGHIEIICNDQHKACSDFAATVKTCTAGALLQPTSL